MENIVKLQGRKASLCLFRTDDEAVTKYLKWITDEEISHWIGKNAFVTTFEQEKEWAKNITNKETVFNIVSNRELVGNCSIRKLPCINNYSLGIVIGEASARNVGVGTEVINLLLTFCFEELGAHRVELNVVEENLRAVKCYEKNGFKKCGKMTDASFYSGRYHNLLKMEILEEEYRERRNKE